jgi:hypothetical protein
MKLTSTLNPFCFLISMSLLISACSNAPKAADPEPIRAPTKLQQVGQSKELRLGIIVRVPGADPAVVKDLTQEFYEQLALFEPCSELPKLETWQVEVNWVSATNGLLTQVNITRLAPEIAALKACVLEKLAEVDIGRQSNIWRGNLILGAYYGNIPPWRFEGPKVFQ